ncbi:hypothetical protein AB0C07_40335 [Actinoplanes missouriensis]|uniref:hypothetical protein n=1 Tax=Actinoplanes missouriensis TaxID=1866 RepID=UPI0033F986C8
MFEEVTREWMRYYARLRATLPPDDPRLLISAEVQTRFGQLDLLLDAITKDLQPRSGESFLDTWDWVSIHTDAFYFFALRIIDLLDAGVGFPEWGGVDAPAIRRMRAELLVDPQWQSDYFRHGLQLRDELLRKITAAADALENDDE